MKIVCFFGQVVLIRDQAGINVRLQEMWRLCRDRTGLFYMLRRKVGTVRQEKSPGSGAINEPRWQTYLGIYFVLSTVSQHILCTSTYIHIHNILCWVSPGYLIWKFIGVHNLGRYYLQDKLKFIEVYNLGSYYLLDKLNFIGLYNLGRYYLLDRYGCMYNVHS